MTLSQEPNTRPDLFERLDAFASNASPETISLWAKSGDESGWLPLPQHLSDTAGVSAELWDRWLADSVKQRLSTLTDLDPPQIRALSIWLAGIHDVGKATVTFQRLIEKTPVGRMILDGVSRTGLNLLRTPSEEKLLKFPHGLAGEVMVKKWLANKGCNPRAAVSISAVIGAHHGIATDAKERKGAERAISSYDSQWQAVHQELLDEMATLTEFSDVLPYLSKRLPVPATELLTGLVIMADWIASNTEAFPMVKNQPQRQRVQAGLSAVDLTEPWLAEFRPDEDLDQYFRSSFGWPTGFNARPIQRAAAEAAAALEGPGMIILEAPTGEGKTEAALAAGHIIAAKTRAQGLLLAAPTMSTANGLFSRVVEWAELNTPKDSITSMNLVHSKTMLSREFDELKFSGIEEDSASTHGSVVASQWLKGTKKRMLANFVVATVDQVLMMALQMRHSMLRHLGLAGKVIIIDEVHAYDLYMSSYLKVALKWLARYHVSVVLLSATLPVDKKHELVEAYAQEFTHEIPTELSTAYPLLTVVGSQGVEEITVESRPSDMSADIEVIPDSPQHLSQLVGDLLVEGGCLLVICNTIRRSQEAYLLLNEQFPGTVELHHSAFIAAERSDKEDTLRTALGPDNHRGSGRPERAIIIATQVAEQSLDIDADTLITDIAPMDLLIQRIGRIHRHARPVSDRPEPLRKPQVFVRGITQREPSPEFEDGSAAVYEPAVLMRTLANLPMHFQRPADIAPLVQTTYDPTFTPPPGWDATWTAAETHMRTNQELSAKRATTFQIPVPQNSSNLHQLFSRYHRSLDAPVLGEEGGAAQVRDADPTFEVIPILVTEYGYRPLPLSTRSTTDTEFIESEEPDYSTALHLASSTVRLPARFSKYESDFERTIEQLEQETPVGWSRHFLLRGKVALCLDDNHETVVNGRRLHYSSSFGLQDLTEESR